MRLTKPLLEAMDAALGSALAGEFDRDHFVRARDWVEQEMQRRQGGKARRDLQPPPPTTTSSSPPAGAAASAMPCGRTRGRIRCRAPGGQALMGDRRDDPRSVTVNCLCLDDGDLE